jgi:hypothetical protein
MMAACTLWMSHDSPAPMSQKSVEGLYDISFHLTHPLCLSDGEHSLSPGRLGVLPISKEIGRDCPGDRKHSVAP